MTFSDSPDLRNTQASVKSGFLMYLHKKHVIRMETRNSLLSHCSNTGLFINDLIDFIELDEQIIYEHLAEYCKLPLMSLQSTFISSELLELIPPYELRRLKIMPTYLFNNELTLACAIPLEQRSLLHLRKVTGIGHFIQVLVPFSEICDVIDQYYVDDQQMANVQSTLEKIRETI